MSSIVQEIPPGSAVDFDISKAFSIQWWLQHLSDAYAENPLHMLTELILVVMILWLMFKKERSSRDEHKLSSREEEELIQEWQPEPLVPEDVNLGTYEPVHLTSAANPIVTDDKREYIHLASHNYLGFANHPQVKEAAAKCIKEYSVGSCGPRGFYGTMDIHLNLEKQIGEYFGQNAIIYPDYMGCNASVITAFAKRGDLLLIDEGCHYLISQGALLSRSNVIWYPHNNMQSLEMYLQNVQEDDDRHNRPLNRRFIVTEGIFHNSGDMSKLTDIIKLKEEYKYRLILDDSHALGVLHPKGSPGYWGIPMEKIDVYLSSMDTSLGGTGAFCVGTREITYHQTLSGSGYVFTASSPPFQCVGVSEAFKLLDFNGKEWISALQENAVFMRKQLNDTHQRWKLSGDSISPLIHLRLNENINDNTAEKLLEEVSLLVREEGVLITPAVYLPQEYGIPEKSDPKPSLRICVTKGHTEKQLKTAADIIKKILSKVLNDAEIASKK